MRGIVKVCRAAAQAEFPSFDVVVAFKVFNLEAAPPKSTDLLDIVALSGRRKVFEVSLIPLVTEFEMLRNIAEAHVKATGARNREAWQHSWKSYHCRSSRQELPAAWLCSS